MPVIIKESEDINVLQAAERRIKNAFEGDKVVLSTSGGKDSICLMDIVLNLIKREEIDKKKLRVDYFDEEATYDDLHRVLKDWRIKFLEIGVPFNWYCLPVLHFNCLRTLSDEESFITWDKRCPEKWLRPIPDFAITTHRLVEEHGGRSGDKRYQDFLEDVSKGCIVLLGIRIDESVHRASNMAIRFGNHGTKNKKVSSLGSDNKVFPIYDWTTQDVWHHIKINNLDFPETYMYLWQSGAKLSEMRISQFFGTLCVRSLLHMNECYPGLMDRIIKREPNTYLVALYWDSEMFNRTSRKRKEFKEKEVDHKKLTLDLLSDIEHNFDDDVKRKVARSMRSTILKYSFTDMPKTLWKRIYETLLLGDPLRNSLRAINTTMTIEDIKNIKEELGLVEEKKKNRSRGKDLSR